MKNKQYIVTRSLSFPIAVEISPSRFKPDRLLQYQKPNKKQGSALKKKTKLFRQNQERKYLTIKNVNDQHRLTSEKRNEL